MPQGKHEILIDVPIEKVWDFVKDMDNWAPLLPGYISHEKLNEKQSKWTFKETVGVLKKKISLQVTIKEWIEPVRVTFDLKGINENLTGNGYFKADPVDVNRTRMTGYLEMTAEGALAPVMNAVMKTSLPKSGQELTTAIAEELEGRKAI
ncbi:SRPBCC family protein [Mesobacillus sp. AQ2]|jgi:carbon monoxide dehydrogenase subunit G|uniref:CoxG family protein n=1 Tax=Bacillaceae TaxID=186817 RepID=UPI0011A4A497|nr:MULTISPECIES: SRPBCC family protein [Bacillaceae]MCM3121543.1 SRPBCC family protein [Mesobacillus sp. MER 33]MCM3231507.1 SRPBCC family protein [Mesobacillus sp. MER 48]WHX38488.1 SRPBCC family protein [Mesobacillus sp. AQ2]